MPREILSVQQVAESLHVSMREVERMAEQKILPAVKIGGRWQFRAGEVWNWIEQNVNILPERRRKDRDPEPAGDLLISVSLAVEGVVLDLDAKTKSSVLYELANLAEKLDHTLHAPELVEDLIAREAESSTALQDGVAVPHPGRPIYCEGPVIAAVRTNQPIAFGQRDGGLTDLFFLICCPDQRGHLLYLGRLCRLLLDGNLREKLRAAANPTEFLAAITIAEENLCTPP